MLEHLDRLHAGLFLAEAHRVLIPGGVLRLVVPDLRALVTRYLDEGDADALVEGSLLAVDPPRTLLGLLRRLVAGDRHHLWMYDARSLKRMLESRGFVHVVELLPGETTIDNPGELDLSERAEGSAFVEARRA